MYLRGPEKHQKFEELKADYDPHEGNDPSESDLLSMIEWVIITFVRGYIRIMFGLLSIGLIFVGGFGLTGWGVLRDGPPGAGRELVGLDRLFYSIFLLVLGVIIGGIMLRKNRKRRP